MYESESIDVTLTDAVSPSWAGWRAGRGTTRAAPQTCWAGPGGSWEWRRCPRRPGWAPQRGRRAGVAHSSGSDSGASLRWRDHEERVEVREGSARPGCADLAPSWTTGWVVGFCKLIRFYWDHFIFMGDQQFDDSLRLRYLPDGWWTSHALHQLLLLLHRHALTLRGPHHSLGRGHGWWCWLQALHGWVLLVGKRVIVAHMWLSNSRQPLLVRGAGARLLKTPLLLLLLLGSLLLLLRLLLTLHGHQLLVFVPLLLLGQRLAGARSLAGLVHHATRNLHADRGMLLSCRVLLLGVQDVLELLLWRSTTSRLLHLLCLLTKTKEF